jgi:hypothetical protein
MALLATITNINPSQGAVTAATSIRIASMSIAAYEYAANCISLSIIITHVLPAISLPFHWNIGYTSLLINLGKKGDANSLRQAFNRRTFDSLGLILFILIRHVSRNCRLRTCSQVL